MSKRTIWFAPKLGIEDEPLIVSLIKYKRSEDRWPSSVPEHGNLVSSITDDGRQMPILDLDFDHAHVESTSTGHAHLYLNVPIPNWRWRALMLGLFLGKQIELGFFVWSIRRGGNFVRAGETPSVRGQHQVHLRLALQDQGSP